MGEQEVRMGTGVARCWAAVRSWQRAGRQHVIGVQPQPALLPT